MRQASKRVPDSAEKTVRDIRRATRRHHSAEEKIRSITTTCESEFSIKSEDCWIFSPGVGCHSWLVANAQQSPSSVP
jgi:hypothetical protein